MVTSNTLPDKKVVKMAEQNNGGVVLPPQRTMLREVNEHITCPLCRGYYIDATTIVECLHSFCRSCIVKHLQVKSYCPVCEMMINSAKPNIKLDKALQDIVYKLVPGLFQREMERRQQFYSSRPGPAASATPEQRGEDTERVIFSPEDVISFSLEFMDNSDCDSISSKSSDSNESQQNSSSRRYLQCPAVVNISHLKKFISMKFEIDSTIFFIDILYKRVPLPDYYTLMDIAYIYNWKRNQPMRFFYQIKDLIAMRTRYELFDRTKISYMLRKPSPCDKDETINKDDSNLNENKVESTMSNIDTKQDELNKNGANDKVKCLDDTIKDPVDCGKRISDVEDEKSQFLNSFELTAKNSSPETKAEKRETEKNIKDNLNPLKEENILKRKQTTIENETTKKPKTEIEDSNSKVLENPNLPQCSENLSNKGAVSNVTSITNTPKSSNCSDSKFHLIESNISKSGNKPNVINTKSLNLSPVKLHQPKHELSLNKNKKSDIPPKPTTKKIPDLKPSTPSPIGKNPAVGKLRMDLLANNSDPTIDRSKILSQVKSSLGNLCPSQSSGNPLKSLFDSCKINIPSSLSITLTDQKLEQNINDTPKSELKKGLINKNLNSNNTSTHKVPSPPVHNYIEILKLPDTEPKKVPGKDTAPVTLYQNKKDTSNISSKPNTKLGEATTSKGPVPSLKPISDSKLAKLSAQSPITFQQTFEQQLQSEKNKTPKTKLQVPKLMPATPKILNAAVNKLNNKNLKNDPKVMSRSDVLDLSTSHSMPILDSPQNITGEAHNLNKKVSLVTKQAVSTSMQPKPANTIVTNRPSNTNIKVPGLLNSPNQLKTDSTIKTNKSDISQESNAKLPQGKIASIAHSLALASTFQSTNANSNASPIRTQTRSPSCSPKLVIAEEKQITLASDHYSTSSLAPGFIPTNESNISSPSTSKQIIKPKVTPLPVKSSTRPSLPNKTTATSNPSEFLTQPQLISAQHAILRHHMEMQNAWIKAQRQYDLLKNMSSNISQPNQNDPTNKDTKR